MNDASPKPIPQQPPNAAHRIGPRCISSPGKQQQVTSFTPGNSMRFHHNLTSARRFCPYSQVSQKDIICHLYHHLHCHCVCAMSAVLHRMLWRFEDIGHWPAGLELGQPRRCLSCNRRGNKSGCVYYAHLKMALKSEVTVPPASDYWQRFPQSVLLQQRKEKSLMSFISFLRVPEA